MSIESGEAADDTTPLSLSEAALAYAGTPETEEPDKGQPEVEDGPEGDTEANEDDLPPDDQEGDEAEEGEAEDEGQADDEDDDEPDSDQGRFVSPNGKVRLPDGSVVPVSELINGNLRDRDYRQKTMEVSELRKATETQSTALKQREMQLGERETYATSLLESIIPTAPDPAMADPRSPSYDPAGYIAAEALHKQFSQHLEFLKSNQQQSEKDRQAQADDETKAKVDREWTAATEKLPELKDAKRLEAFGKDVLRYGAEYGYTPQELAVAHHDHRSLVVLKKAIAYDKMIANKSKVAAKVEGKPPVQKGGTRLDPTRAKARDGRVAMDRLDSSGSLKDGVAALLAIEGKG